MNATDRYRARLAPLADPSTREAWRWLHERSPQGSPFTDIRFADALAATGGQRVWVALATENDEPAAGLLVYEKRRGPYRAASLPALANYNGVLLSEPMRDADVHYRRTALDALLALVGGEFQQATLALHHTLDDVRPFTWLGWAVAPRYTYLVDIQSAGLPAAWSSTHRHTFSRHRDEYDVRIGDCPVDLAVEQILGSYMRRDEPFPCQEQDLLAVTRNLQSSGMATPAVAVRSGEVEAGLVLLGNGEEVNYWLGGSSPGPAMTVLLGSAIEHLRATGTRRLDLTGANVPSIAEFKRKFGAERTTYYRSRLVTRPELRILESIRHPTAPR